MRKNQNATGEGISDMDKIAYFIVYKVGQLRKKIQQNQEKSCCLNCLLSGLNVSLYSSQEENVEDLEILEIRRDTIFEILDHAKYYGLKDQIENVLKKCYGEDLNMGTMI